MKELISKSKWKYLWYTLTHPMDGYYWIRHEDKGSVPIALLLVVLFSFSFSLQRRMASFVVNDIDPREVDSFYELGGVLLLFFLFCVGNWSITCLMDGEGRLKDIMVAVGFATVPLIVSYLLSTFLSFFIADNEQAYYYLILVVGVTYAAIMALIGIMQIHNYTLGKTLVTLFLTILAMLIILFLLLMFVNLVTQVVVFIRSIYTEIIFRT